MAPHQAESQDGRLLEANRSSQIKNSKEKDLPARNMASILANEICIDGIFYDLTSFEHPGGAAILMFGGNDATVHYKMIHAHHQNGFTRVHKNMTATGRAVDYSCEYVSCPLIFDFSADSTTTKQERSHSHITLLSTTATSLILLFLVT